MRLLIVTTVPDTLDLILRDQPGFFSKHHEVAIASSNKEYLRRVAGHEKVRYFHVPMVRGINPLFDLVSIAFMITTLLRFRPDLVHSYTPKAGLIGAVSAWVCRVPRRVHTFTGLIFPTASGFKRRLLLQVDRLICKLCTRVIPEGEGVKMDLVRFCVTSKPLDIVGNGNIAGVDLNYFDPDNAEILGQAKALRAGLPPDCKGVFCFIGRINRDKGVTELVDAFMRFSSGNPACLLVAGELESPKNLPSRVVEAVRKHERIKWLGFVRDIRPVLMASDCLVLPSYREGFPNVVLQAGAMRRPAIVSNISGCNEIISEGANGLLVRPADENGICDAMTKFAVLDKHERNEMGKRARRLIEERFDRTSYLDKLEELYASMV